MTKGLCAQPISINRKFQHKLFLHEIENENTYRIIFNDHSFLQNNERLSYICNIVIALTSNTAGSISIAA